jgi:hypothetical protein
VHIEEVRPDRSVLIELSYEEFILVTNSVSHAAQFIDDRVYQTLVGLEKEDADRFSRAAYSEKVRVGLSQPRPPGWEKFR